MNSKNAKKLAKEMTKFVNHKDFPKFMKKIENWRVKTESNLTPEQKEKLDIMLKIKKPGETK